MSYSNFMYQQPTSIIFGRNSVEDIGLLARQAGAVKVLIVIGGESVRKNGSLEQVICQLEKAGIEYHIYSGCTPNPRSTWIDKGAALFNENSCDFILAVGGGSVIDASKAIALLVSNPNKEGIWHYMTGRGKFEKDAVPLASVLTIAATGSECNNSFVISNEETMEKLVCSHESAIPVFSICDPEYTYSVGKWQTACGISDTISHVLEQYLYNDDTAGVSNGMCIGILKAVLEWGPVALKNPDNYDARANLMWASTLGLNGILGVGHGSNWTAHMLEHALSAVFDVSHGAGLACLTPHYLTWISSQDTVGKIDRLGIELFGLDALDEQKKEKTVRKFRTFFASIGMPSTLTELVKGPITESMIDRLAEKALPWGPMEAGRYRPFTVADAKELFKKCRE